ncbi:MAG TPA: metalloregulator ArsR/SmtB family transcription factor [Candidatus Angelobacter sp.]|jgi:DNA-binding transcriptional ArsR family regulator|nr:metalloregulator ArsR/SmtB family transcription factor [Candidatus Angelobacter sp.]
MNGKSARTVRRPLPWTEAEEALLDALGDRTRRQILQRLRDGPKPVVEIASGLSVSRPAVSQHLKVLKDAGLVTDRAEGTRRIYAVDPDALATLRGFLESFWRDALSRFKDAAERPARP